MDFQHTQRHLAKKRLKNLNVDNNCMGNEETQLYKQEVAFRIKGKG